MFTRRVCKKNRLTREHLLVVSAESEASNKISEKYPFKTKSVVDEFVWGGKEKGKKGRNKGKKKEAVMAIG